MSTVYNSGRKQLSSAVQRNRAVGGTRRKSRQHPPPPRPPPPSRLPSALQNTRSRFHLPAFINTITSDPCFFAQLFESVCKGVVTGPCGLCEEIKKKSSQHKQPEDLKHKYHNNVMKHKLNTDYYKHT